MAENPTELLLQASEPGLPMQRREALRQQLIEGINYLLLHDFTQLVQLLYRVDVSEKKLKQLLQEMPQADSAVLITDLLLQRHEEKIQSRQSFNPKDDLSEEERW